MDLTLQKNYKWTLTETLQNTATGEVEIKLSIAPTSDVGFITIEPGVNGKEETIFYHRIVGNSIFVYGVNRDNPLQHIVWSAIVLANSIDVFNYLLEHVYQAPYIFKKSTSDVIIKGGKFYINNTLVTIDDLDTSLAIENKVLDPNDTNYVYIKDNDYFINQVYDATLYPVADIITDAGGVITSITKHKFKDIYNFAGYAPLDDQGKIPFQYLPAVFASIQEYPDIGSFPAVGEAWVLYSVVGSSIAYRWDWSDYIAMTGIGDLFSGNNLSELTDMQAARDNLNVYSQIEIDAALDLKMDKSANLSDLANNATARTNLDVYSKAEIDVLSIFWSWIDWDLIVSSGTTNISTNNVYEYENVTISAGAILSTLDSSWNIIIKCRWVFTLEWDINLNAKFNYWVQSNISSEIFNISLTRWTDWQWWDWWAWWFKTWQATSLWWTWTSWYWWWGGGWSAHSWSAWNNAGWNWWVWGTPGWNWWATASANWWTSAWWAWAQSWLWNPWWWAIWTWWDAYSNVWNPATQPSSTWTWNSIAFWWGGWSAWEYGGSWWNIIIYAKSFAWSWTINVSGWNWTAWAAWWAWKWMSTWWSYTWWGGWWGWGGWGGWWGIILLIWWLNSFSWTTIVTWWTWWTWWTAWANASNDTNTAAVAWVNWTNWASGVVYNKYLKEII